MEQTSGSVNQKQKSFSSIIVVISILMILFGLAEVVTSFTHQFFGLATASNVLAISLGVFLGLCYIVGGVLLLTRKAWAASVALVLLGVDILGRIAMVILGLYPLDSFRQGFGIVAGTLIAAIFAVYIFFNLKAFSKS